MGAARDRHHRPTDADDPAGIVARFRQAMSPGSYLALSHGSHGGRDQAAAEEGTSAYDRATSSVTLRTRERIAGLFGGFSLVDVSAWRRANVDLPRGAQVLAGVEERVKP